MKLRQKEIATRGATKVETDYLEVKRMGVETAASFASETDSTGALTASAQDWLAKVQNYNLYKESEDLDRELKSFVQEYEATLRRSAETQNEEMKAMFNSCADTIKNKLNESIDPKAITDAIKAGTNSSTKTKEQIAEIIKQLGDIKN